MKIHCKLIFSIGNTDEAVTDPCAFPIKTVFLGDGPHYDQYESHTWTGVEQNQEKATMMVFPVKAPLWPGSLMITPTLDFKQTMSEGFN